MDEALLQIIQSTAAGDTLHLIHSKIHSISYKIQSTSKIHKTFHQIPKIQPIYHSTDIIQNNIIQTFHNRIISFLNGIHLRVSEDWSGWSKYIKVCQKYSSWSITGCRLHQNAITDNISWSALLNIAYTHPTAPNWTQLLLCILERECFWNVGSSSFFLCAVFSIEWPVQHAI